MEKKQLPALSVLKTGETFKVYEVTGYSGMAVPSHHSTKEAVVIIKEGKAVLHIQGGKHQLEKGDVFIIPEQQSHTLEILSEFRANIIMGKDSDIEFEK
ncbi:MAG TPA: cupin domain-containing protein [Bacteroidales bacterium]|jgi:quercetin dioxygenase-like cupin family protein|nr:cupin domain-containing protein [Bacteroidales bacterium]